MKNEAHSAELVDGIYLVSESADLGVGDIEDGGTAGGRDDGDTPVRAAQLQETFIVGSHRLVGHCHMIVVA